MLVWNMRQGSKLNQYGGKTDQREFPTVLQASTNLMVDNARAQWTTFDILNQWIDDVKNKLIKTGLVVSEQVLDGEGALVSEV